MNRSLFILLGALAAGMAIFASSYFASQRTCEMTGSGDDLSWLHAEFHLSDAEMQHVRQLHEDYLPQCAEMCARIAAKKQELQAVLGDSTNVSAAVQAKLTELGILRAQCQAQMLQHFVAVSQAMPPEQGRRYLAEMQQFTLGFHKDMEPTMSHSAGHEQPQP